MCMGDGGGGYGGKDASPLASKNLSPPVEPKIRDLQKKWARKGEKLFFLKKIFIFFGFLSDEMALMLLKNCFSFSCFHKNPCFLLQKKI